MTRSISMMLLALSLVACSESRPVLDTGVPDGTQVDELTDEQARQICERAERLANDVFGVSVQHETTCLATGIGYDIANIADCDDSYRDCISEPFEGQVFAFTCEEVTAPDLANCDATIGQIEACANAQLRIYDDLVSQIDCSLADDPARAQEIVSGLDGGAMPVACTSLPSECPIFFDGLGGDSTD